MKPVLRCLPPVLPVLLLIAAVATPVSAEPIPLKRIVELALSHSTVAAAAGADEQRAFAAYLESRNQYIPQLVIGSGLGKSWGYPLSLEGSAPSIVNVNAQSALINPALREFVRAAHIEWQASRVQNKDQRDQVMLDAVLTYAELAKWEGELNRLQQERADAAQAEKVVSERIQAGVDNPLALNQARLSAAQAYLLLTQAQGSIDVLRQRLSQMTGVPAGQIQTASDSIPTLPPVKPEDDLAQQAVQSSPVVEAARERATAFDFRARGEHRSLWPSVDFAAQYGLLATFNNYQNFFVANSFQRNNATVGVAIRFPFFSPSQHARAQEADAQAIRAHKDAQTAKDQVSAQTLQLQRSVEQLSAAQQVAEIQYEIAESNLETVQVRSNSGGAGWHDLEDARTRASDRYNQLQDANFEYERAQITLLRTTGGLEKWLMGSP